MLIQPYIKECAKEMYEDNEILYPSYDLINYPPERDSYREYIEDFLILFQFEDY
jgi:hypothetical protein